MADDKPKIRNFIEARIAVGDGFEVAPERLRRLEREQGLCRAAVEWPVAVGRSRIRETMLRGKDYRLFWQALTQCLKQAEKPDSITLDDIGCEMSKREPERFSIGEVGMWLTLLKQQVFPSLSYTLGVLVAEMVAEHDLERFKRQTGALNDRVGVDEPIQLFHEYVTGAYEITRSPDGRPASEPMKERMRTWVPDAAGKAIIPSGIDAIDISSGGGPGRGDLVVAGGGTNHGKSYLGEQLAYTHSTLGQPFLYLTVEDPEELMLCRMVARHTNPEQKPVWMRRPPPLGHPDRGEYKAEVIAEAQAKVDAMGCMYVDKKRKGRISDVVDMLRRYRYEHGIVAACVDYLQAIQVDDPVKGQQNLIQETAKKVGLLKEAADSLGIALYVMSQYSREAYKDGQEPGINSCKYAGDIENEAEIMVLLWKTNDGQLYAKIPKAKWVETKTPRYIIRRQKRTGCFTRWEPDFSQPAQGQQGGGQGGQRRPGPNNFRGGGQGRQF